MAQNLFEKYGIKEVADVTLYRIERKDETYESQRKISISSILKGALTKQFVYPLDEDGKGENDGYEAYVFKDADVLTHYNYDCDDTFELKGSAILVDTDYLAGEDKITSGTKITDEEVITAIKNYLVADADEDDIPNLFDASNVTILSLIEKSSNRSFRDRLYEFLARGYSIKELTTSKISDTIIARGTTKDATSDAAYDLVTYEAKFITPFEYDLITKANLQEWVDEHGGETEWNGETLTGGYIRYTAPVDATLDEIVARFHYLYKDLYDSVGVVSRLTQPVKVDSDVSAFSGTIVAEVTIPTEEVEADPTTGTVTFTFENAELTGNIKTIVDSLSGGATTLTLAQLRTLIGAADGTTIEVEYSPAAIETDIIAEDSTAVVNEVSIEEDFGYNKFLIVFEATLESSEEIETGRYDLGEGVEGGHYVMDTDREVGTHEFSYPEQICMLFAKNQNLITKAGTRYSFENANQLFGGFDFDDSFATAPNGRERTVVVGLSGRISENLYDIDEVNDAIKELTDTIEAKAYDVTYTDYAELVVNDEMGYYVPAQLGYYLDKKAQAVSFFSNDGVTYKSWSASKKGTDLSIYDAIHTWGNDTHYSINDAIDALKQQQKILDGSGEFEETGFSRVFGGYKVVGEDVKSDLPLDDIGRHATYGDYTLNGVKLHTVFGEDDTAWSYYNLDSVIQTLSTLDLEGQVGQVRITETAEIESNRAIYVDPDTGVLANRAAIYLLKNINSRSLGNDKNGIFEFYDKKGNRLYYQDKVFAGTALLALVVIGTYGLVFVVDRHCTKNFTQTAWMINDNGYITDKQAERIVKNGLIHTVTVTACDESFDATCTVGSIKVRKTKKNVLRYVPVLFLDTLKVSTLEQASESTDATGGRGNAKLITWDYGKEITLSIEDALYTPASMAAIWAGEHGDLKNGVKDTTMIDRMEKITAKRSFIVPAGNSEGTPTEGNATAQAVYYDPKTMEPFQDGTPIAEGEVVYKFTRSVAYDGNSIGNTIEISADKFPGTYKVVGETFVRDKATGEDQRFQFIIPEAKMSAEDTSITLEADGDPVVRTKCHCRKKLLNCGKLLRAA